MKKFNDKSNVSGDLIKKYRTAMDYTKADLSRLLDLLGISMDVTEINRVETNRQVLKDFELIGFIKILNISLDDLKKLIGKNTEGLKPLYWLSW